MRIAIIGAGLAGLTATWTLATRHRVTLYERAPRVGGHTQGATVEVDGCSVVVDAGWLAYSRPANPALHRLLAHLGVTTTAVDGSFALSVARPRGRLEYGSRPWSLLAQPRNLVDRRFLGMLRDLLRFHRAARRLLRAPPQPAMPLGAMLAAGGYGRGLVEDHLLPLASAIQGQPPSALLEAPAVGQVRALDAHGLLDRHRGVAWRAVPGGRGTWTERLLQALDARVLTATAATRVRRRVDGVDIADTAGTTRRFDHVVLACHADEALALLDDPTEAEAAVLSGFAYREEQAVLHGDTRLMPASRRTWSAWNYRTEEPGDRVASVTVWLNRLQALETHLPLLLTVDPPNPPSPDLVYGRFAYDRPQPGATAEAARAAVDGLQGQRRTWHAGGHLGSGLPEDALMSGLAVATALGAPLPWPIAVRPAGGRRTRASAP